MRLAVENLRRTFTGGRGLQDVSLQLEDGEVLSILGPSGCGKSTTLRCVAGLEAPESGRIVVDGSVVYDRAARINIPPRRRDVGMVFQGYAVWPHMSVFDNVAYPLRRRGVRGGEIRRRVSKMLELLNIEHHAKKGASLLSGGEQQRVSLARALVAEPGLVLYDEPLSSLDRRLRETLRREIRELHERLGIAALYVTHDRQEALYLSDRIAVMCDGRISQLGSPEEVFYRPTDRSAADVVGFENVFNCEPVSRRHDQLCFELAPGRFFYAKMPPHVSADVQFNGFAVRASALVVELVDRSTHTSKCRENVMEGVITDVGFLGDAAEISVSCEGRKFTVRRNTDARHVAEDLQNLTVGCRVVIRVGMEEVVPLRLGGSGSMQSASNGERSTMATPTRATVQSGESV